MQLSPRYDGAPIVSFAPPTADPSVPMLRQRRRLEAVLATFDDGDWSAPTRCEGWSARDVVSHLVTTNQFWTVSVTSGLAGNPTQYLAQFDPVATPAQLVESSRAQPPAEVLAALIESDEALASALTGVGGSGWATTVEAPPGHVTLHSMVLHALWDSWIHERDILVPRGEEQVVEDDEVAAALEYGVALGPAFLASTGSERAGLLAVQATDPEVQLVVELGPTVAVRPGAAPDGTPVLRGPSAELVDALSFRTPLPHPLDEADQWLLGDLAEVFDLT